MKQVNWGIIGLGSAALQFANSFNFVKNAKLLAIASKNPDKIKICFVGFTDVNIEEMFFQLIDNNADMVIASTEYKVDIPYAVFECDSYKVNAFKEKPSYTYYSNAGIYLFKKELIPKIPKNSYFDITDLMDLLVEEGKEILHNPIKGYWIDIGTPSDYEKAKEFIKRNKLEN